MKGVPGLVSCCFLALTCALPAQTLNSARIEQITGLKGSFDASRTSFKVSTPRTDVAVTVDGWPMQPFRGLGSWAAFSSAGSDELIVMGDFVLFQDEVNPVMSAALDNGLAVTALHNHFFFDEPRAFFMHISGEGPLVQLATGVRRMLDKVKEIRAAVPNPASGFGGTPPAKNEITSGPIEEILAKKGKANQGMLKLTLPRETRSMGVPVGGGMGVATWAAFGGTDGNAIVDGDFAVLEDELQPVLKALRHGGVNIVAIHNHMTHETPRVLFLHYWGKGPAEELARTLRAALDTQSR